MATDPPRRCRLGFVQCRPCRVSVLRSHGLGSAGLQRLECRVDHQRRRLGHDLAGCALRAGRGPVWPAGHDPYGMHGLFRGGLAVAWPAARRSWGKLAVRPRRYGTCRSHNGLGRRSAASRATRLWHGCLLHRLLRDHDHQSVKLAGQFSVQREIRPDPFSSV